MKHLLKTCMFCLFLGQILVTHAQIMSNTLDPIPAGWTGKKFQMSKNYPTTLPSMTQPWKSFDFRTQPLQYINAVKQYVLAGNITTDWVLQNNTVRKWYHAPSMVWGTNGREFINGMTRERSSRPGELHPNQSNYWQNWAVGFYNPRGGYTLGRVYKVPHNPDVTKAIFPEGTIAAKLLFTNAPLSEVPYLQNAFTWQGNIHTTQSGTVRAPGTVRLLQMDIAVKDNRAGSTTDWVMITFAYNNSAPGTTPWDKLVPVGLEWGNDPASISSGTPLTQTWINPAFTSMFTIGAWTMHKGYLGRLNGPVDNPKSTCLSCHGTAQDPVVSTGMVPNTSAASISSYFRNINPPSVFEDNPGVTERSLDYSLQLSVGIPQARMHPLVITSDTLSPTALKAMKSIFLTTRDFEPEDEIVEQAPLAVAEEKTEPVAPLSWWRNNMWMIILGTVILFAVLFLVFKKRN